MNAKYLFTDWFFIVSVNALFLRYPNALTFLLMVFVFAAKQHALLANLHESIHGHLFKNPFLNKWMGILFCGLPIGVNYEGFKHYHLLHHRFLNSDLDPAWIPTKNKADWVYPMALKKFIILTLKDFSGINFVSMSFYENLYSKFQTKSKMKKYISKYIFYVVLTALIYSTSGFLLSMATLAGWIISKYTFLVWLIRLRTAIEHYGQLRMTEMCRDVKANFIEEFFIIPHHTGLHFLHHKLPNVPAWTHSIEDSPLPIRGIFGKGGAFRDIVQWEKSNE